MNEEELEKIPTNNQIQIYQSADGELELRVPLNKDTVRLAQDQLYKLFDRERSVITKHVSNVFREGEPVRDSVRAKFARTADDGKTYKQLIGQAVIAPIRGDS